MNKNVRQLTDGAMMCAIVGVMLLINRQTAGFIEDVFLFLFPLPMVFFSAKYGWKKSIIVLVAIILLTVILGTPQTIFYVTAESIIGLIYGNGVYKKTNTKKLLIWTMVISVLVNVITVIILANFFGYDLNTELNAYQDMFVNMTNAAGVAIPSTINMSQYIRTIMTVSVMITGCLEGFITHAAARVLLKRFKFDLPASTPLEKYFPPVWTGYLALAGTVAVQYTMMRPIPNALVNNIVQGLGMCGMMYLSIFGYLAVIFYGKKRHPKMKLFFMLLAVFLLLVGGMLIAMIGFLYITTSMHQRLLEGDTHATENV